MEISIFMIRDIMSVRPSDNAIVHIDEDGNIVVSQRYRGHNIVTWFKGDGVMWIYDTDSTDIDVLKNLDHALYDTHWSMSSDCGEAYRKVITKFIGE